MSPLERVRQAALELPETEERLSHGQPTFFVAGKQFAQFRDNHHGDGKTVVCVRVSSLDEQAMLLEADPETYSKPAYMPSWLSINLAGDKVDWDHVADRIARKLGACGAAAFAGGWRSMSTSGGSETHPPALDRLRRDHRGDRGGHLRGGAVEDLGQRRQAAR